MVAIKLEKTKHIIWKNKTSFLEEKDKYTVIERLINS
jgi:hypothetical protein